jgi:hypothetical protein
MSGFLPAETFSRTRSVVAVVVVAADVVAAVVVVVSF